MLWDFIVIGAGSAGCAVAHELARTPEAKILVLEAGGSDRSLAIKIPAAQPRAIRKNDWGYVAQRDDSRNGKVENWERGRVLGGSSSINGMMYVRGAPADFDRWAEMGNSGWGYADILPLYREMETSDQAGDLRGHDGPLSVTTVRRAHPLTEAFVKSAIAAGLPFNEDYNGLTQYGVGYAQLSQLRGLRCSSADAFLKPLVGRKNLKISLKSIARKLHLRGGRVAAVEYERAGILRTEASRRVVVCGGAINTPKLLMLSGMGDPLELHRHGIEAQVDLPNVGRNLREHPLVKLTYRTKVPSNNLTEGLSQRLRIGWQYLRSGSGPIANIFEAVAFLKSSADIPEADLQLHFLSFGLAQTTGGDERPLDKPSVTVMVNASHPRSVGRIELSSNDPQAAPRILCSLLADEFDLRTLIRGVSEVRRIMGAQPVSNLILNEVAPGPEVVDGEVLESYIRAHAEIAYHPSGTCRMGLDARAVVTPDLQVRGVDNLWIADASVMPDLISGNTNAVCMMIGLKLGRYLNSRVYDS